MTQKRLCSTQVAISSMGVRAFSQMKRRGCDVQGSLLLTLYEITMHQDFLTQSLSR